MLLKNIEAKFNAGSFKRYFFNTSWLMGEKIARSIATLIVGILLARYLGPHNFGILSYSISFVALFLNIVSLGLDDILYRELVKNSSDENELLGTAFLLRLISSITAIFFIVSINIITKESSFIFSMVLIIATGLIFKPFLIIESFFYSKVASKFSVFAYLSELCFFSLLQIFFIIIKAPLLWFAYAILLDGLILAIGLSYNYLKSHNTFKAWKYNGNIAISLLRDSWPLILSGMTISIYMKIDQVMIKYMLNATQVGIYAVAVKLSESWYFIPVIICNSLFPAIIKAGSQDRSLYNKRLQQLYSLVFFIALCIAILMTLFSNIIISVLYGSQFIAAVNVLKVHIWAGLFVFLGVANSKYLVSENLTKIFFLSTFFAMVLNIFLNIIFIPRYGIIGAAMATLISYFSATFFIVFFKKTSHQAILMLKAMNFLNIFKIKDD